MPTSITRFSVVVIMQRTPLANRWASERWDPVAVLPVPAGDGVAAAVPVCIRNDAACTQWRFDGHELELHRSESEGYHLNLVAPDPKIFVDWRTHEDPTVPPVFPVIVTVSYNEAARMMDGGERSTPFRCRTTCAIGWFHSSPSTTNPSRGARCAATIRSPTTRFASRSRARADARAPA